MTLFVSYTRSDKVLVRAFKDDLERVGHSVWLDHQIHGGERWWQEIIHQIQDAEVFLFALSKDSWRSRPCRAELRYAEQLRVPVIPVQVGPFENIRIPLAEQQIIDYRQRSTNAVIDLIAAVIEVCAQPRQLPDPLPDPPEMPFEYLYRIASRIDIAQIPPDDQGQLITELRRQLKTEQDDVARKDILMLLTELRSRNELTVPHAAEIDEILSGSQAEQIPPAEEGTTRLPPANHRRSRPGPSPAVGQSSISDQASPPAASRRPDAPASWWQTAGSSSGTPAWLTDLISRGTGTQTGAGTLPVAGTVSYPSEPASNPPPHARKWWLEEQNAPQSPAAPTISTPAPPAQSPTPQPPSHQPASQPAPSGSRYRFAFVVLVVVLAVLVLVVPLIVASAS